LAEKGRAVTVDGLVVVDKPPGWTSHDVVARCRKIFGQRKVGHAGTLDPGATGVLLVGLGQATRLLRFISGLSKSYRGEVVLGRATSTLDDEGQTTGDWDMSKVTLDQARAAARDLTGVIWQTVPMVSAVHVGGRRLHELAREGIEVERIPRQVTVQRFEVDLVDAPDPPTPDGSPVLSVTVECSSGTYVRSLADDLGAALGGGAHLRKLRRLSVGPFSLREACPLDEVGPERVLTPAMALRGMASVVVPAALERAVGHGQVLDRGQLGLWGEGPWALLGAEAGGRLLAVYESHGSNDGRVKPAVVLDPGPPLAGPPVAGSPVAGSPVAGSPVAGSPIEGRAGAGLRLEGPPAGDHRGAE
jgi:tRNA pseudouridine55 synthase